MLPDCKSGRTFLAFLSAGHSWRCCRQNILGAFAGRTFLAPRMFIGICNPDVSSIRICNPLKSSLLVLYTDLIGLKILIFNAAGLQIRQNILGVFVGRTFLALLPAEHSWRFCRQDQECSSGFAIPMSQVSGFVIR